MPILSDIQAVMIVPIVLQIIKSICEFISNIILRERQIYYSVSYGDVNIIDKIIAKVKLDYLFTTGIPVMYNDTIVPTGFVIGRLYMLYIESVTTLENHQMRVKLTIGLYGWWTFQHFASECQCNHLINDKSIIITDNSNDISTITSYIWKDCLSRVTETHLSHSYHNNSVKLADKIEKLWRQSPMKNLVVLIYGERGSGKSKAGIYLNKLIPNSVVYKDFDAIYKWLRYVVNEVIQFAQTAKSKTPIIFIWDEIDEYLLPQPDADDADDANQKPKIKVSKPQWNGFIDFIRTKRNIILLLTSNVEKKVIDAHDSSLFRRHRIDNTFKCNNDYIENIAWNDPQKLIDTDSDMTSIESVSDASISMSIGGRE